MLYIQKLQIEQKPKKKLDISHPQFDILCAEVAAQVIVKIGGQLILVIKDRVLAADSLVSRSLQAFQGNFTGKDKAVELVQDGKLFLRERSL